jgi:phosphatidylinositol 4-phosphatase
MLARWTLNRQLTDLGVLSRGETFTSADPEFEVLFRKLWADNADVVSKSYSGTGALKTDFTRTGVRTKAGALQDLRNSITRYAKNNFLDGPKQDAFDLFLGAYLPQPSSYLVFADKRPLLIQSIPYVLAFSFFFVFVGIFTRRLPDSAALPVRIFIFFWFFVGLWALNFIFKNGMLYVSPFHLLRIIEVLTSLGELAQTQPSTMGHRRLSRSNQQCTKRQANRSVGRETRTRSKYCEIYECRGG